MTIGLFELIAWVETKNDQCALRFEPAKYSSLITGVMTPNHSVIVQRIMNIHRCSLATAQMIFSTSFGAVQLMGFNIYGLLQYDQPIFSFINNLAIQQLYFAKFLTTVNLEHYSISQLQCNHASRLDFAIKYNGSIVYEKPMIDAFLHFGLPVTA